MREITEVEVPRLSRCLQALAEYHNEVSNYFKGSYPSRPYEKTLALFEEALAKKISRVAVVEVDNQIVGFCKVDMCGENGKLDYLVIQKEYRGKGYGTALMDWAMQVFDESNVHHIEVKVVDGNEAIHLYEKYGFKINAHILVNNKK